MKRFDQIMSPLSWAILFVCFSLLFLLLFRPSVAEFALLLAIDSLAFVLAARIDRYIFLKHHPETVLFFPREHPDLPSLARNNSDLFYALVQFPDQRARHCCLLSLAKVVPGLAIIIFFWKPEFSLLTRLSLALIATAAIHLYFYSIIVIEHHRLVSKTIGEIHRKIDWSDAFKKVDPSRFWKAPDFPETPTIILTWICMLLLQRLSLARWSNLSHKGIIVTGVGLAGILLTTRIWYLGRKYFIEGLNSIFRQLESFDPDSSDVTLPLHSTAALAGFEKAFNSLQERRQAYQRELSRWISLKTEEKRFATLGELSALILHDLRTPLHVLRFCIDQLIQDPERALDYRYQNQMKTNNERSLELINSLRSYLRNEPAQQNTASFVEAHECALRLLESQFYTEGFHRVKFDIDPNLSQLWICVPHADLIHVLLNLYQNSLHNLLLNKISEPRLIVNLEDQPKNNRATIRIRDNGTGLSIEQFEQMTSMNLLPANDVSERIGLGLRLVRRLIERHGGTLMAEEPTSCCPIEKGTCLRLSLLTCEPKQEVLSE